MNGIIKIKLLILGLCMVLTRVTHAQTDTLKLNDVSITAEVHPVLSNGNGPTRRVNNDTLKYKIVFELNSVANTDRIYIKIGNSADDGQLLNIELIKQMSGSENFLNYNGQLFKIWSDRGYCIISLVNPPAAIKWLTINAKDVSGNLTQKRYLKF